jgi:hypothetical protein
MPDSYGNCPACQHEFEDRTHTCYNPNCPEAQRAATADASRTTSKATAAVDRPRAFTAGGRVD